MANTKGNIENAPGIEEKDERLVAVESITESTPAPADESSEPGPYNDLSPERPPVSTQRPDVAIAQSLVEGAGAPTPGNFDVSQYVAPNAYVTAADKENIQKVDAAGNPQKKS